MRELSPKRLLGMECLFRYYQWVHVTPSGECKYAEDGQLKHWLTRLIAQHNLTSDDAVQVALLDSYFTEQADVEERTLAERCLYCKISHYIKAACEQIIRRCGDSGIHIQELYYLVLGDKRASQKGLNQLFCANILATFDPYKGNCLSSWVSLRVRRNQQVERALLEYGIINKTDWSLLMNVTPTKLQRILEAEILSLNEIQRYLSELDIYHTVYRRDWRNRPLEKRSKCPAPSDKQLQEMYVLIKAQKISISVDDLLSDFKKMAVYLRKHKVLGKTIKSSISLNYSVDRDDSFIERDNREEDWQHSSPIKQELDKALKKSIESVIAKAIPSSDTRNLNRHKQFIFALKLIHCEELTQLDVAPYIGLASQYQVSRFLKLKNLRVDIRHQMLRILCDRAPEIVEKVLDISIEKADQHIESFFSQGIIDFFEESERRAFTGRNNRKSKSLFDTELCSFLDQEYPNSKMPDSKMEEM